MKNLIQLFFILFSITITAQNKEIPLKTEVNEVTVFINGAQVTREKSVDIQAGNTIVRFVNLSPYLDAKSIQVKVNTEIMVLSVNHQFNYIDSIANSNEMNALADRLKTVKDQLKIENVNNDVINEEISFLKENKLIGGKNQELSLNNLKETSNFYRDRVSTLMLKQLDVTKNIDALTVEKIKLENQIKQITLKKPVPLSEIVVKINSKTQNKCNFVLSYFVNNASWLPTYDIRAKSIDEPIEIIYKANIHQNTKEEWKNVKLILSSSNPKSGSTAPQLQPYILDYYTAPPKYTSFGNEISGQVIDYESNEPIGFANITLNNSTIGTVSNGNGFYSITVPNFNSELTASFIGYKKQTLKANRANLNFRLEPESMELDEVRVIGKKISYDGATNVRDRATAVSRIELKDMKSSMSSRIEKESLIQSITETPASVEFEIKTPYTIGSDNKNMTVEIDDLFIDAIYEYYSAPKVDKDAFLMASITNLNKYNFLDGEANVFFENTFVGKSLLNVTQASDTLKLSLGRDKNVIIKREKTKDYLKKQFLGNKKEETRAWLISIKNNKKQPININFSDQVPVSTNEEIEVLVENTTGGFINKTTGEINWSIKLEPSDKKEYELKYKIKYPKDRHLDIE
jgi:hypothetical protein